MDNQHKKITGYRDLSQEEIDLMNEIKAKGEELKVLLDRVDGHLSEQKISASGWDEELGGWVPDEEEDRRLQAAQPCRWTAIARTDLQTGIMALVRAVAQPTSF